VTKQLATQGTMPLLPTGLLPVPWEGTLSTYYVPASLKSPCNRWRN
jgi:hypothetical protein